MSDHHVYPDFAREGTSELDWHIFEHAQIGGMTDESEFYVHVSDVQHLLTWYVRRGRVLSCGRCHVAGLVTEVKDSCPQHGEDWAW